MIVKWLASRECIKELVLSEHVLSVGFGGERLLSGDLYSVVMFQRYKGECYRLPNGYLSIVRADKCQEARFEITKIVRGSKK
jgi:hypothetical protein